MITFTPQEVIKSADLNANFASLADGSEILDGAITIPKISNPYTFHAYRNGTWTTASGVNGKVNLETTVFDYGNNFDTSAYRYNVPVTGIYQISFGCGSSVNSGSYYASMIYKNGTFFVLGSSAVSSNTFTHHSVGSIVMSLTAGDYLELYYRASGAAGDTGQSTTYMSGALIHKA